VNRIWIFRIITLIIPILFFLFLELGLRIFGYGEDYSLFIENPQAPQYLLPRPDAIKRYFPRGAPVPPVTIETNFFKKKKPKTGLRIFVQGGSTAAGFPYGYGASLAGMLDYRLKQTFPDRPVEVVNTALSAVNSFTMLDFSSEIIAQDPDAVLIYAGHNEFLGVMGVGSYYTVAGSYGPTLLFLKLRRLKIFQLLRNTYWRILGQTFELKDDKSRTTMSQIAKHRNIPYKSKIFAAGITQFEDNIALLMRKYQRAEIPVFIATVASNLSGHAPFASLEPDIADTRAQLLIGDVRRGQWLSHEDLDYLKVVAKTQQNAELFFLLGRALSAKQRYDEARAFYEAARNHDLLRFRAPSEINEVVRVLASQYDGFLVDAESYLAQASPHGIIGSDLMLEHLHPTVTGYFLISDAFYQSLKKSGVLGRFPHPLDTASAQKEIPLFEAEKYLGHAKIASLKADYPFADEPVDVVLPARKSWSDHLGYRAFKNNLGWLEIATASMEKNKGNKHKYAIGAKLLSDALPYRADYAYAAGVSLIQSGRAREAPRYLLRAIALKPGETNYQLALIHSYVIQGRAEDIRLWVDSVLRLDPGNNMALEVKNKYLL